MHRDVKPANILVDEDDHAYLTDFGVSKQLGGVTTDTGRLVGTLDYLAPEQIRGERVDARTDQYALACVLYECLTGAPPFQRETEAETLWAHMQAALRAAPTALDRVFKRASRATGGSLRKLWRADRGRACARPARHRARWIGGGARPRSRRRRPRRCIVRDGGPRRRRRAAASSRSTPTARIGSFTEAGRRRATSPSATARSGCWTAEAETVARIDLATHAVKRFSARPAADRSRGRRRSRLGRQRCRQRDSRHAGHDQHLARRSALA